MYGKIGVAGSGVVAILLAIVLIWPGSPPSVKPLGPAPDFVLPTDRGDTVSLSQLRGRPVVVHFVILVCCAYSALEIGYMKEIAPMARDGKIVFISIAMDSSSNYYSPQKFREVLGFDWTLALDLDGAVQLLFRAHETSTFVIDGDGLIRHRDDTTTSPSTLSSWLQELI